MVHCALQHQVAFGVLLDVVIHTALVFAIGQVRYLEKCGQQAVGQVPGVSDTGVETEESIQVFRIAWTENNVGFAIVVEEQRGPSGGPAGMRLDGDAQLPTARFPGQAGLQAVMLVPVARLIATGDLVGDLRPGVARPPVQVAADLMFQRDFQAA